MSNRVEGYGLTKEVGDKIKNKYSIEDENQCLDWMDRVVRDPVKLVDGNTGPEATQDKLRSGVLLCRLINEIINRSDARGKINTISNINLNNANNSGKHSARHAFMMKENIGCFLDACEKMGVEKHSLFQTVDLYDGVNMHNVLITLFALGRKAQKFHFNGPVLGPRESSENRRSFTMEQLNDGRNVIGLQMSSHKGATQSGINFGQNRSISMDF